jgi:hypothetical protein
VKSLAVGIGIAVEVGVDRELFVNPKDCWQVTPNADTDRDPDSDTDIEDAFCLAA